MNFQVPEKANVRFTPTPVSQTLIKLLISFPHWVCCTWSTLSACGCFLNADAVLWRVFFFFYSLHGVIPITLSWTWNLAAIKYLSFIWHLPTCFFSVDSLFPISIPAGQRKQPQGYGLLFTNQPSMSFSPFSQSFFFTHGQNSFGAWENLLNEEIILCLCSQSGFPATLYRSELLCPLPKMHLHFFIMHNSKKIQAISQRGWKRSYRGFDMVNCWLHLIVVERDSWQLIEKLVSYCTDVFILLTVNKTISERFCITEMHQTTKLCERVWLLCVYTATNEKLNPSPSLVWFTVSQRVHKQKETKKT